MQPIHNERPAQTKTGTEKLEITSLVVPWSKETGAQISVPCPKPQAKEIAEKRT